MFTESRNRHCDTTFVKSVKSQYFCGFSCTQVLLEDQLSESEGIPLKQAEPQSFIHNQFPAEFYLIFQPLGISTLSRKDNNVPTPFDLNTSHYRTQEIGNLLVCFCQAFCVWEYINNLWELHHQSVTTFQSILDIWAPFHGLAVSTWTMTPAVSIHMVHFGIMNSKSSSVWEPCGLNVSSFLLHIFNFW